MKSTKNIHKGWLNYKQRVIKSNRICLINKIKKDTKKLDFI